MHAAAFGLKRAHQATLNIARATFHKLGITAARFDMLRAITQGPPCGISQRALRVALGVTGATVSRMLKALETMTLVRRERDAFDGRQRRVTITRVGRIVLRRATRVILPFAQRAFLFALTVGARLDWLYEMDNAEWVLRRVREAFQDTGRVLYPWHPDD